TTGELRFSDVDLRAGPLRMRAGNILNDATQGFEKPIFKNVDAEVAKWDGLQRQAAQLWAKVQQPIRVGKDPETWLSLEPIGFLVRKPIGADDTLIVGLGMTMRPAMVVGPKPAVSNAPLPSARTTNLPPGRFVFAVPVLLPYDQAAHLAASELAKRPLRL